MTRAVIWHDEGDVRMLDVLIIAPHPDDAELGMGGTICKFVAAGWQVGVLDLTNGEPTPHGSVEVRAQETQAATQTLGLRWRENLGLPNRSLQPTLEARAQLAAVLRRTRPRWLFAPYWVDAHPDHVAATQLIEEARFWSKLTKSDLPGEPHHPARVFYYFCVHLRLAVQPAFIIDLSQHWSTKLSSLECYRSQFLVGRPTEPVSFLEGQRLQAAHWGHLIGRAYGEPFAVREPLGLEDMASVI